jgi:hypothetical protein
MVHAFENSYVKAYSFMIKKGSLEILIWFQMKKVWHWPNERNG